MRFVSGRPVSLSYQFDSDDETPLTPSSVTVTVRNALGATVSSGSAVKAGSVYTFFLPSVLEGKHTVTWSGDGYTDSTAFEVTGSALFTVRAARDLDETLTPSLFPAADIRRLRDAVEEQFEDITGRSFVPRTALVPIAHDGSGSAMLPVLDVQSCTALYGLDGTLVDVTPTLDHYGSLVGLEALPVGSYRALVRYGFTSVPEDIRRVGVMRLRHLLTEERSGIPDRATSFQAADGGMFMLATAGRSGWETGIPEVDATLNRYTFKVMRDVLGVG